MAFHLDGLISVPSAYTDLELVEARRSRAFSARRSFSGRLRITLMNASWAFTARLMPSARPPRSSSVLVL